jgi:hypothetical protein
VFFGSYVVLSRRIELSTASGWTAECTANQYPNDHKTSNAEPINMKNEKMMNIHIQTIDVLRKTFLKEYRSNANDKKAEY